MQAPVSITAAATAKAEQTEHTFWAVWCGKIMSVSVLFFSSSFLKTFCKNTVWQLTDRNSHRKWLFAYSLHFVEHSMGIYQPSIGEIAPVNGWGWKEERKREKLSSVVSAVDMRHFIKNFNFSSCAYFFRCVVLNKKIAKSVCWRCRSMLIYMPFMFGFSSSNKKQHKTKKWQQQANSVNEKKEEEKLYEFWRFP